MAINEWKPTAFFRLNLLYLATLIAMLIGRQAHWVYIDHIDDPIGGIVPIGVPWFGALGAVVISIYGVFDHNHEWDTKWNYWHAARPFVGAIFGTVAFLIFVGLINATGSDPVIKASTTTASTSSVAYLVLAFVVGFREETFRMLIKRAVDILLGPGIPGETRPSVAFSAEKTQLDNLKVGVETQIGLTLSNLGGSTVSVNTSAVSPRGADAAVTKGTAVATIDGLEGDTVDPSSYRVGTLKLTPTQAGDIVVQLSVNGSFGTRTITLKGTAAP